MIIMEYCNGPIDPETHEETKSTVPYALHMDQTSLVMTLHGFGNVIDKTGVACGSEFVSIRENTSSASNATLPQHVQESVQ